MIEAYDSLGGTEEMGTIINELRNWDYRTSETSKAMTLAHYYGTEYLTNGKRPEQNLIPMELLSYFGTASPLEERMQIFKNVIARLETDFGNALIAWGDVNRFQRINGDIRQPFNDDLPSTPVGLASGRWGALAAYGERYTNNTKKIYGTRGNSFVAVVEFGNRVKAKTSLAGGQSGDPDSPHFDDQIEPLRKWKI